MTDDEVKRLKTAHVLCKDDFTFFTRYVFKAQYKRKWSQWAHLIIIADALKKVVNGEITRLIINVFPRGGKTELAVKTFMPYGLSLNPQAKFIHLSYSDDLALDNSEMARDIVNSDEYQKIFPYVTIKKTSDSKKKWYTEDGGGVYATSTGGQITGFGAGIVDPEDEEVSAMVQDLERVSEESWLGPKAKFGGAIIIDDPNKVDDADSELQRKRVNERYDSTISNRVNSRRTPIIILQQRTHEDDLSGYLIRKQGKAEDGGVWTVISLPSIKEDGTALCPEKFTIEELLALQAHNDVVFQRQHMQNPKPRAGLLFPIDDLKFFDPAEMEEQLADPDFCYSPTDPAGDQGGGDDFASGFAKLIGNKIYITDVIFNTKGTDHNEVSLMEMVLKEKCNFVGVEAVFGFKETANRISEGLYERGWRGDFRQLRPRTNKHTRIVNRSSFIVNNFVFRKDWDERPEYAKFMRNLTSYMKIQEPGSKNKHDDAPDVMEMVGSYFEKNFPNLWQLK